MLWLRSPHFSSLEVVRPRRTRQNALLKVRFRDPMPSQRPIPLRIDAQTFLELRDDGAGDDEIPNDRVFTGRMDFDEQAFRARRIQEVRRATSLDQTPERMSFDGRDLVSREPIDTSSQLFRNDMSRWGTMLAIRTTDPERTLLIRDLSVVADPDRTFDPCDLDGDGANGDPDGAWTFKTLMTQMANHTRTGIRAEQFVEEWLNGWRKNFDSGAGGSSTGDWIVNTNTVPERENNLNASIVRDWPKLSSGELDLDAAPFRLLAIVNRTDLTDALAYSPTAASAGELRFVFGLVDQTSCAPDLMSVIFEYEVEVDNCLEAATYAQQWEDLQFDYPAFPATPGYLAALQTITDTVVAAGATPGNPNGSAIAQVRTSEAVMGLPWEMREFNLQPLPSGSPGQHTLRLTTTKQTPELKYTTDPSLTPFLRNYMNAAGADICDQVHEVPEVFTGEHLLAGRADFDPTTHFNPGTGIKPAGSCSPRDVRHRFSLNTCSGCHAAETIDPAVDLHFYHIHPDSLPGGPVDLSRFLTGTDTGNFGKIVKPIPDPAFPTDTRDFHDLRRRARHLAGLVTYRCYEIMVEDSEFLGIVHGSNWGRWLRSGEIGGL